MKNLFKYNRETLQFEKVKKKSYAKVILVLLSSLCILFIIGWLSGTNKYIINRIVNTAKVDTVYVSAQAFSEEALIDLLRGSNIKYPHIVLAQAKIESGNYTSKIFKENNNLFGMKEPNVRTTTALGTKSGHAYYSDWVSSVYDYAMFQNNRMQGVNSESEYYAKLADGYAADSTYASVIKKTVDSLKLKKYFQE
jgi:uncharacterized FlgJ-related protein